MYRKKIVAQDEKTVAIPKEVFYEMTLKIQHLEQAEDDHEYLKYDFQQQKERIDELEDELEEAKDQIHSTLDSQIQKKLQNENQDYQANWLHRFKALLIH